MAHRLLIMAFLALSLPLFNSTAQPMAKVQFIQNSPDLQLSKLDVYVNDKLVADNLVYHTATPMLDLPAGASTIVVRDSNAAPTSTIRAKWTVNLVADKRYVAVINGVVNLLKFPNANSDREILLEFQEVPDLRLQSAEASTVDLIFNHGAPQWPGTNLFVRGRGILVNNITYGQFSQYKTLNTERYLFDLKQADDENHIFGTYDADLRPYGGRAMVVVWSGVSGQPPTSPYALRMIGVLQDGTVVPFSLFETPISLVQIVHNSPTAEFVPETDVYINEQLIGDNMGFQTATPLLYIDAGRTVKIDIAQKNSASAASSIERFNIAFEEGRSYTLFMAGLHTTAGYKPNPDGIGIGFQFLQIDEVQTLSQSETKTNLIFANLTTDLPSISFVIRTVGLVQENVPYRSFGPYQELNAGNYVLDITRSSDPSDVLATFFADMSEFGGRAGIVFTSGFYYPDSNKAGPSLKMFCVFTNGEVVEFPRYIPPVAKLQLVHNSPDPVLKTADVYLNGELLLNNFSFRKATRYIEIPAGVPITLDFAPGNSTSAAESVYSRQLNPVDKQIYFMILQGVTDQTGYLANPDGKDIAINTYLLEGISLTGIDANSISLNFIPGAMDQGTVDLRTNTSGQIFGAAAYGVFKTGAALQPQSYLTSINFTGDTADVYKTYVTDFPSFGGQLITLITSGFMNPASNNGGPAFGLYGVFADGRVYLFPEYVAPTAQMQFIHNAADPGLDSLDLYVNGTLTVDNLLFRGATEFLSLPATDAATIAIAAGNSASSADAILSFTSVLTDRKAYLTMIHGVEDPTEFAVNPAGADISFSVDSLKDAKTYSAYLDEIELTIFHGATDAGTVDIIERDAATLLDNLAYGVQTGYATYPLLAGLYDITDSDDPSAIFGSYLIDLSSYGGKSGVIFFSGFDDPDANRNGAELGLFIAFPNGTVIEFNNEEPKFAGIQLINNTPYINSDFDVYVNRQLVTSGLNYLEATTYLQVPAGEEIEISAGPRANDPDQVFTTSKVTLVENSLNFGMLTGVIDPAQYPENPEKLDIKISVLQRGDIRLTALDTTKADLLFVNGVVDLPAIDFKIVDGPVVFDEVSFNEISGYQTLDIDKYKFDVVLASDSDSIISRFDGDISDLRGIATLIFTSGFYKPLNAVRDPALTLQAVFPNGSVVPFDILAIDPEGVFLPAAAGWDMSVAPNPAVSGAAVRFTLQRLTAVHFTVYDQLGRARLTYDAGTIPPGTHTYQPDLSGLGTGNYIVVMQTQYGIATRKLAIVR